MLRFTLDGVKYEFDPHRLMNVEAMAVKRYTGLGFREWMDALGESDVEALTGLVYVLQKRAGSDQKFTDVEFNLMEMLESLESDEEPDAESDPTDTTMKPGLSSQLSPTTSESVSGSSTD